MLGFNLASLYRVNHRACQQQKTFLKDCIQKKHSLPGDPPIQLVKMRFLAGPNLSLKGP